MTTLEILKDYVNTDKWKWSAPQIGRDNCIEIIDALEKQVVKKMNGNFNCVWCECGNPIYYETDRIMHHYNYCCECGHKLDWSD